MEAAKSQLAAALGIGGIAALCAAPSLTSAVGGIGSALQTQLNLLLPEELQPQQYQPEPDMLLMKLRQNSTSTLTGGKRRSRGRGSGRNQRQKSRRSSRRSGPVRSIDALHRQRKSSKDDMPLNAPPRGSIDALHRQRKSSKDDMPLNAKERNRKHRTTKTGDGSKKGSKFARKLQKKHRKKQKRHRKQEKGEHGSAAAAATGMVAMGQGQSNYSRVPQEDHETIDETVQQAIEDVIEGIRTKMGMPQEDITPEVRIALVERMPELMKKMAESAPNEVLKIMMDVLRPDGQPIKSNFDKLVVVAAINVVAAKKDLPKVVLG